MNNYTTIKIPDKYQDMISEIGKDSDGYYIYSADGFYFKHNDSHSAFEDTQKQVLSVLRYLDKCNCDECK